MLNTPSSRRFFLKAAAAAVAAPMIVPSSVFGANAPSNRINVGCIGVGRMGMGDMSDALHFDHVRIVAVCDVDSNRRAAAKKAAEAYYAKKSDSGDYKGCTEHADFRELLAKPDIDAVQIVTPDHWHALIAIEAAKAGKDIFLQKPLTNTIAEGRALSDAVRRYGRVFQCGSQQRSETFFRTACELVRNGRIGKLQTIKTGFGADPAGKVWPAQPVPPELDYNFWLGPAPEVPYTEERVHPRKGLGRPGWLRIDDYCLGMITAWGSHHNDIAQWAMGTENTGPVEITGKAEFPKEGLWDVHGAFNVEYTYANGVKVICSNTNREGVTFEGTEGSIWVTRGKIDATPKSLLSSKIGPGEIHLYESKHHKGNWFDCIRTRQDPIAAAEIAHRSCSVCILGYIAMKLGRKLQWNAQAERFVNDPEADRWLSRSMRAPWKL